MGFLQGLHGTVAILILCTLLFAEEAGIPIPFAPGEISLLVGGLLIAAGALNAFLFIPFAIASCLAGSLLGYSWAAFIGPRSLDVIANRLHQEKALKRVEVRLLAATPVGIGVARIIPGLRVYTTLVSGAIGVRRRTFLLGVVPATALWVGVFVAFGALVGLPAEHYFNEVAKVALQGGLLLVIGVGGYIAIRKVPISDAAGTIGLPGYLRIAIAAVIDIALVASIVTGALALGRRLFGIGLVDGWIDAVVSLFVVGMFYVVVTRRGAGGTVGESLMRTTYASGRNLSLRPRPALRAMQQLFAKSEDQLSATADLLRSLSDRKRLGLVGHLIDGAKSPEQLSILASLDLAEVQYELRRLQSAGAIIAVSGSPVQYELQPALYLPLSELLTIDTGQRTESEAQPAVPSR